MVPCGSSVLIATHCVYTVHDLCMLCCYVCHVYSCADQVQLSADFQAKKEKEGGEKNRSCFSAPSGTMFIHYTTLYEAGHEHCNRKEGCTSHRYVASTPRTSGLSWLPSCNHPQSRVLIFSALFLTIWSIRVTGTLCFTDLSLCVWQSVCACIHVLVYMPAWKMSQICLLVFVDLAVGCIDFVSICFSLPAKNTFISSTNIDAENVHSLFTFCCVGTSTMAVFLVRWDFFFSYYIYNPELPSGYELFLFMWTTDYSIKQALGKPRMINVNAKGQTHSKGAIWWSIFYCVASWYWVSLSGADMVT